MNERPPIVSIGAGDLNRVHCQRIGREDFIFRRYPTPADLKRAENDNKLVVTIVEDRLPRVRTTEETRAFVDGFLGALGLERSDYHVLVWVHGMSEEEGRERWVAEVLRQRYIPFSVQAGTIPGAGPIPNCEEVPNG